MIYNLQSAVNHGIVKCPMKISQMIHRDRWWWEYNRICT